MKLPNIYTASILRFPFAEGVIKKNALMLLILILGISSHVQSQRIITLNEAIAAALQKNYSIQLARTDSAVAALDYSYRNMAFYPRVNGNVSQVFNINDQKQNFTDGTKRERNGVKSSNLAAAVGLNWTLFDGMKMYATRDKAGELVKLGELTAKAQVVQTVSDIALIYYNIVSQKQQSKAIEEQITLNQIRVDLAQRKLDIGTGTKPEVLQSKVDVNALKSRLISQGNLIRQLKEQLLNLIQYPQGMEYEVSDSIPIQSGLMMDNLQQAALQSNPDLLLLKKNMDIASLTLKERMAERWPTVSFTSNYNFTRTNNKAVVNPFQPLFSQNKGLNYGLTAAIPIFNNYNSRRLIQQVKLTIDHNKLQYEAQKSAVLYAIFNAYIAYSEQKKILALEQENIELAKENVKIIMETYRLNSATLLQLREAQKSLEDAYTRLITARYTMKMAEIALLKEKGELVK